MIRRLAFVVALLASACSSAPNRTLSSDPPCRGERTVIVSNRSNREADVVAERKSGGAPYELGTVQPGRQEELALPADALTAHTRAPEAGSGPPRGRVDLRYGCRQ